MALTAHVKIDKELMVRWYRRAYRSSAIFAYGFNSATKLIVIWLFVAVADALGNHPDLAPLHGLTLFFVWIGVMIYDYYRWYHGLEKIVGDQEFDATVDDHGVTTDAKVVSKQEHAWSFYKGYREYDDHLEIHYEKDKVTFLPKTEELAEVIAFTKEKIRRL